LAREKVSEVLPQLEELVKRTGISSFENHLFSAIRNYIRDHIPPKDVSNNLYREKIYKLKEGLEKLLDLNVRNYLFELYWGILFGDYIPSDFDFYLKIAQDFANLECRGSDWKAIKVFAQEEAARNYLSKHIECLLSNPEGYMQHLKSGDLEDFIRESCKPIPS